MRFALKDPSPRWQLGILALILVLTGCGSSASLGASQEAAVASPAGSMVPARTPDPVQAALPQASQSPTMTPRTDRAPSTRAADLLPVYGTVVTADGTPIVEAAIDLDPIDINGAPFETIVVFSDAQGQYRWDVQPGRYQLTVTAVGYHPASQVLVVAAGAPVTTTTTLVADQGQ